MRPFLTQSTVRAFPATGATIQLPDGLPEPREDRSIAPNYRSFYLLPTDARGKERWSLWGQLDIGMTLAEEAQLLGVEDGDAAADGADDVPSPQLAHDANRRLGGGTNHVGDFLSGEG